MTTSEIRRKAAARQPAEAKSLDWLLLAIIVVFGGSAFAMIKGAVSDIPPAVIAVGRLWIGAIVLYAMMKLKGRRFPAFMVSTDKGLRLHRAWAYMLAVGAVGNTLPFFIFPWAQQHIESGLAGVYMAFMPIWTLVLAFFFTGEKLTRNKAIGFALGFVGVMILMGPDVIRGIASSSVLAQGAILLATFLYAASAIIARRAPRIRPRVFSAGMILCAAVIATPALFFVDLKTSEWTARAMLNVVGLGVFPTGLGGILIIILIKRAGASFMALANYITPLWAVFLGVLIYGERLDPNVFIALAIIFTGVYISQRKPKAAAARPAQMPAT